jgi:hypothetical protein
LASSNIVFFSRSNWSDILANRVLSKSLLRTSKVKLF